MWSQPRHARYAELGRHAEDLIATEEAVTIYQPLAEQNPGSLPDLADTLSNLGNRYAELGRHQDALIAQNPGSLPGLTDALSNLCRRYAEIGRHEEAITAAEETVTLHKLLAEQNPGLRLTCHKF